MVHIESSHQPPDYPPHHAERDGQTSIYDRPIQVTVVTPERTMQTEIPPYATEREIGEYILRLVNGESDE